MDSLANVLIQATYERNVCAKLKIISTYGCIQITFCISTQNAFWGRAHFMVSSLNLTVIVALIALFFYRNSLKIFSRL